MKLVVDMNLSPAWVALLESAGHSAVHWSSVGPPNAPDMEIMGWAADHGAIVLTHDLDFSTILAAPPATVRQASCRSALTTWR